MEKIIVKHSRIEIHNYDLGDAPRLERSFSIWKPVEHKTITKALEYDRENRIETTDIISTLRGNKGFPTLRLQSYTLSS